jgi:hypothetical protein
VKLPPEWSEFIRLLSSHRVRFVVVGAHALAVHGHPRATGDLDIFVDPAPANAARLGKVLRAFGFRALARDAARFAEPDRMATLGREPLRIDVMTSITGVDFATAWRNRRRLRFGGRPVGFLGRCDLIRNKRAAGRPQDTADLVLLAEARVRQRRRRPRG